MDKTQHIVGAEKLVAVFGYWPSFHDAEVLWVRLNRQPRDEGYGPTLESMIHAFEMTSEVDANGCYVLRHHVLFHFRFHDVVELELDGFNHQNAILGLKLVDLRDRQMERVQWEIEFDAAFGMGASFQCYKVEIVRVVPCSKSGEPIATEVSAEA